MLDLAMADRDLIHKPLQLPAIDDKRGESESIKPPIRGPLGVQLRAKEIGKEHDADGVLSRKDVETPGSRAPPNLPAGKSAAPEKLERAPAFRAAYFNQDVAATNLVNQRTRNAQALRGGEGAADLRRVVLPPPAREGAPDADVLRETTQRMTTDAGQLPTFADILQRQGSALAQKTVTPEIILARMRQLEAMVASRKEALARMARSKKKLSDRTTTLRQADRPEYGGSDAQGHAAQLIEDMGEEAAGLHRRLAKVIGVRR